MATSIMTLHYASGREEQIMLRSNAARKAAIKDAQRAQREGFLRTYKIRSPEKKR